MGVWPIRHIDRATLSKRWRRWRKKHGPEVLHRYRLTQPRQTPDAGSGERWPGAELKELDAQLLEQLARWGKELNARKKAILASRIDHPTQTCWVILADGEAAGYCHVSWESTVNERIHHPVRLRSDEVYLYDSYVFRKFRRRGLHHFSILRRLELAAERGKQRAVTIISRTNTPSRRSFAGYHARRTGTLLYLPPLRRTLSWPSRGTA